MSTSDDFYKGREQTQVKHFILQRYLTDMAFKVALSKKDQLTAINFVDGFSGPWETRDEDNYSDTSFRKAIEILRTVRSDLQAKRNATLPIRFVFCEENKTRHVKLCDAVSIYQDVEIHCIHGRFEESLKEISRICSDGFTFSFIDPSGFKLHTLAISEFLRSQRGEFMWNYMADHANRFANLEELREAYGALLAEQKWFDLFNDPDLQGLKNEEKILVLLREKLKELGCADYVIDFPVMRPRVNRVQFRLLFGTRSAAGVVVFRMAQKKAEEYQATRREEVKQEDSQTLLVTPEMHAESFLARDGINGTKACQAAPERIASYLNQNGAIRYHKLLAPILETERLTEPGLKDVLVKMRKDGLVAYDLPPRKKKPQSDTMIALAG